jgi:hypothetical protein
MGDKMRVERPLIDDLATRDVNQDRVLAWSGFTVPAWSPP